MVSEATPAAAQPTKPPTFNHNPLAHGNNQLVLLAVGKPREEGVHACCQFGGGRRVEGNRIKARQALINQISTNSVVLKFNQNQFNFFLKDFTHSGNKRFQFHIFSPHLKRNLL